MKNIIHISKLSKITRVFLVVAMMAMIFFRTDILPAKALYTNLSENTPLSGYIDATGDNGSFADSLVTIGGNVVGPLWDFINDCLPGAPAPQSAENLVFPASLVSISSSGGGVSASLVPTSTGSNGNGPGCNGAPLTINPPTTYQYSVSGSIDVSGWDDNGGAGRVYSLSATFGSPSGGPQIPPESTSDSTTFLVKHIPGGPGPGPGPGPTCDLHVQGVLNGISTPTGASFIISGGSGGGGTDDGNYSLTVPAGSTTYSLIVISSGLTISNYGASPSGVGGATPCSGSSASIPIFYTTDAILQIR